MSTQLTFVAPPPGFSPLVDFLLEEIQGADGLYALRSGGADGKRLFVLDAATYLPEYVPVITDQQQSSLQLETADQAQVLVVANPSHGSITVNLMAPIVVNRDTRRCAQLILESDDWPLQASISV